MSSEFVQEQRQTRWNAVRVEVDEYVEVLLADEFRKAEVIQVLS
jgi:hypothetical protein